MTLVEKILQYQEADFELWLEVNRILGFEDLTECVEWPVRNSFVDSFDTSLEILCAPNFAGITRAQADQLLDLGFKYVFENIGEKGTMWTPTQTEAYAAKEDARDRRLIEKYRNELQSKH